MDKLGRVKHAAIHSNVIEATCAGKYLVVRVAWAVTVSIRAIVASNWDRSAPFDAVANVASWEVENVNALYIGENGHLSYDPSLDDVVEVDVPTIPGQNYRVSWSLYSTVFPFILQIGVFKHGGGTYDVFLVSDASGKTRTIDFLADDTSMRLQIGSVSDPANRGWQFEYLTVTQL